MKEKKKKYVAPKDLKKAFDSLDKSGDKNLEEVNKYEAKKAALKKMRSGSYKK